MATKKSEAKLSAAELAMMDVIIADMQEAGKAGQPQPFYTVVVREVAKVALRAAGTAFCAVSEADRQKLELMATLAKSLEANVSLDQMVAARASLQANKKKEK